MQWALSVGRYLVIFTELVVIISFGTRFTLDRRATDLNSAIYQKKLIIESLGDLEERVRDVQQRIESYKQIEQQQNLADAFPALTQITPPDIVLEELTVQPGRVGLAGTARSNSAFNTLITNIQLSPAFADVVVDRIESGTAQQPGLKFRLRAALRRVPTPTPGVTTP